MSNEGNSDHGLGIPASRRALCVYCGELIDTAANHTFQLGYGWIEQRRGGGNHATQLMQMKNQYACKECIAKLRKGISTDQGSLFALNLYDE